MTLDPATMLPTAEFVENGLPAAELLRLVEIEVREPDFNKWTQLARAEHPAASLSEATAGDLDRSLRQREIRRPGGFADELRAVLAAAPAWGALTVFRETRRPHFSPADVQFVSSMAGLIADGLRRGLLLDAARAAPTTSACWCSTPTTRSTSANPAAQPLARRPGHGRPGGRPPAVGGARRRPPGRRARRRAGPGQGPSAHPVRPVADRPGVADGRRPDAQVAVLLEAARPAELAPLIADAYGFTDTERRVTELVAQGLSTKQIAGPAARHDLHRAGPPEVDLQQVRRRLTGRAGRPAVLRPLRRPRSCTRW